MKKIRFRKPRINMIIGKKQIVIVGLTLVLGVAIYANYVIGANNLLDTPNMVGEPQENYGDAAFVSKTTDADDVKLTSGDLDHVDAYFAQARLDKQESRDEAKEFLSAMYNGGDGTIEELEVMAQSASKLSDYIECESKVETLLKAQGFTDVLCYLSEESANIIVRTDGLEAEEAAKIKNTLLSEITVPSSNITILEIK